MKAGVFICHCGHNIASTVDVERLKGYFKKVPSVASCVDYTFLCSEPGQRLIREEVKGKKLERVIIGACTPSLHIGLFRDVLRKAGLNPYLLKVASIREHCSFVGEDIRKNTEKAKRLILSALYGASHLQPLMERRVQVQKSALIIGGGVAGLSAALFLSRRGIVVYLVEKENRLGGQMRRLRWVWPKGTSGEEIVSSFEKELLMRENFFLKSSSRVKRVEGFFGDYTVTVETPGGEERLKVGGIIIAVGVRPFEARHRSELAYGKDRRILTTLDVEEWIQSAGVGKRPRVAILHCVGSRDERVGRPYCSKICCLNALRVAEMIKQAHPEAYVESFYTDMRAHTKGAEEFYEELQGKGVIFTRASISELVPTGEGVLVRGEDTLLSEVFERVFDLVVLSVGMVPAEDAKYLASILHIPLDKDGFFLEAHPKLRPLESPVRGIFLAGSASGPKDAEESIVHGRASAAKLFSLLRKGQTFLDPFVASVWERRCSGCRMCESVCIFRAISWDEERRKAKVQQAACTGCGLCASLCPSSAITLLGSEDRMVCDEIGGLLEALWNG